MSGSPEQREPVDGGGEQAVYHVELRQFPHNLCRFNLGERELRAIVVPWASGQWIELGERKWTAHQAKLTVLQGPRIELQRLSLGRGWRVAEREGRDVTAALLSAVAKEVAPPAGQSPAPPSPAAAPDEGLLADSLGLELLAKLGADELPLRSAWQLAAERHPQNGAGQTLALAERAVAALARSGLLRVCSTPGGEPLAGDALAALLREIDSSGQPGAWVRRG